jgi:enoyl-CoA hydratase/carnithine racemase
VALVEVDREGPVATLTLNRPEARNALSADMCDVLSMAVGELDRDPEARAVVVKGAGPVFCSGADFAGVSGPDATYFLASFERMLETLARLRLPTIAAIRGAALGGGLQLATVCDFRVAADDAKIGIPSSKIGIVVNFENVQRLVLLAGIAVAKEVLMTGQTYSGTDASRVGLVNRAVPADDVEPQAHSLAADVAARAPLSVQGAKKAVQIVADHLAGARTSNARATSEIDELVMTAYRSGDLAEGLKALSEKRPPTFDGL